MTKMRTSRKEDLRSNQLIESFKRLGEGMKKHIGYIALGAAVVVVAVVLLWRSVSDRAKSEGIIANNAYRNSRALHADWLASGAGAVTLDRFKAASEQAVGKPAATLALLGYGDALLMAVGTDPKLAGDAEDVVTTRSGMVRQAKTIFERALAAEGRTKTTDALSYLGLSGVSRNLGDFVEARKHAETAKSLVDESSFAARLAEDALKVIDENPAPVKLAASRPVTAEVAIPGGPDAPLIGPITTPLLPAVPERGMLP